ncbi:glutamate receptor, ionotropic kainate 3 [Trichonephila clavipes]|nr:glutamate receptor, ionotropic kainate 3 [Trichonephila clavipes]
MEDFKYGKTNITGFRLVDENNADLQGLVVELNTKWSGAIRKLDFPIKTIRTETALMYDAVQLFAKALQDLDGSKSIYFPNISCDSGLRGLDGSSIINFMKPFGLAIHQNDHQARRRFVEWAQNEIAVVPDFHKRILFSDEAHFWLNGYVNKQNCRILSEANPQVYVETPLHPEN